MCDEATQAAVIRALEESGTPLRSTALLRAAGCTARDLLAMEYKGALLGSLERDGAGPPVRVYRLPSRAPDPADVRAYTVATGLVSADDDSPVTPPEYRAYESWKAGQDRLAEIEQTQERNRQALYKRLAEDNARSFWDANRPGRIRKWARAQGYFVGERGRLPQWLVDAYDQEHGADEYRPQDHGPSDTDGGQAPD
ncbi:Lsr2 family DNA-binding protein [Streptomyces rimosus]|uniref:Lsr2 family DNA-binding protein n=1 Tax=Streptomyces rimosus TaxID=1927 RepID=UPI0004BE6030|nr:histone-like nucleoid-structuring protein Lsr2 [Streptomyces rimosus]